MAVAERRFKVGDIQFRASGEGEDTGGLVGYASVFDREYEVMGFREVVRRGAFKDSISGGDVRALWNHDSSGVLGRQKSGTLKIREDEVGLRVEIDPPDTQLGRDALELVRRGDVDQMSIGFFVEEETWKKAARKGDLPLRELNKANLEEVSIVAFPASEATSIQARMSQESRSKFEAAQWSEVEPEGAPEPEPQEADEGLDELESLIDERLSPTG